MVQIPSFIQAPLQTLSRNKNVMQLFSIYFATNIGSKIIPFVLLPVITFYLSPEEFGLWSLFLMMVTIIAPAVALGGQFHIARNFHEVKKQELATHFYNMIALSLAMTALLTVIAVIMWLSMDSFLSVPSKYLLIIPFLALCLGLHQPISTVFYFEKKAGLYALSETVHPILYRLLAIGSFMFAPLSWIALVIGFFASSLLRLVMSMLYLIKHNWLKPPFNKALTLDILKVNLPLVPYVIFASLNAVVDRIMLEKMTTTEEVGVYSVGYIIGAVCIPFMTAFSKIWLPWVQKQLSNITDAKKRQITRYSYAYFLAVIMISITIIAAGSLYVSWFFGDEYQDAVRVIFWIGLSAIAMALSQTSAYYLNHLKKTGYMSVNTFFAILLNVALNLCLIPLYGIEGAAIASFLATSVNALIVFIIAQIHLPLPWLSFLKSDKV